MIQTLSGNNFSGKSFYMQCYSGFPTNSDHSANVLNKQLFRDNRNDLYIGPIADYFITGIYGSVESEIFKYQDVLIESSIREYIQYVNLPSLYTRNPFTLSGGEKAVVSILAMVTLNPRSLSIDCTMEQLSKDWKLALIKSLFHSSLPEILLADNRISELPGYYFSNFEYSNIPRLYSVEMQFLGINSNNLKTFPHYTTSTLTVSSLSFAYGNKKLFKNLNMEFEGGKIYHLKGENGSGKSTLSKILSGVLRPSIETKIFFNGKNVNLFSHPGRYVGYTFQQPDDQLFSSKVREEMELNELFKNGSLQYRESLTESFGLSNMLEFHPFDLPISMRKRLSIAAALAVDRPFYILDEPTLYLDDMNVIELKGILEKLMLSGKGIIIISHSERFIQMFKTIEVIELHNQIL